MLLQNWFVITTGALALILGGIANFKVFGWVALILYSLTLIIIVYIITHNISCFISGGCRSSSWVAALSGCLALGSLGLFNYYALTKKVQLPGLEEQNVFAINPLINEGVNFVQARTGVNVFAYIKPKSESMG